MRKIVLVNYKTEWKTLYENEVSILSGILCLEFVAAHHIGSTAIPGIKAKPIIDILLEVKSIENVNNYNRQLQSIGYEAKGEYGIKGRRFFQKGGNERSHHLHVFEKNNPEVHRHINFRDYLIKNRGKAKEYEDVKVTLAKKYMFDPESYAKEKNKFIRSIEKDIVLEYFS